MRALGFLSPSCSSQQNVAPVSYRLEVNDRKFGSKEQDSSWQRHSSKINPLGDPQCGIFGSNVLSSSPCASCGNEIYIILLVEGQFCHGDPHKEGGSALICTKISFISLQWFPPVWKSFLINLKTVLSSKHFVPFPWWFLLIWILLLFDAGKPFSPLYYTVCA